MTYIGNSNTEHRRHAAVPSVPDDIVGAVLLESYQNDVPFKHILSVPTIASCSKHSVDAPNSLGVLPFKLDGSHHPHHLSMKAPDPFLVHGVLFAVQVIFGCSTVVGAIGLSAFHPLTFALVRETSATCILLGAAHWYSLRTGRPGGLCSGSRQDIPLILLCGLGIFSSQAFFIVGIKLSSAVAASVWQPSQPIIMAAICMMMGWEPFCYKRIAGIFLAFLGCAAMVLWGSGEEEANQGSLGFQHFAGHASFFFNCFGASLYVLASKVLLATGRYESLAVTAWSYAVAAAMMAITAYSFSFSTTMSLFLCDDCDPNNVWHVPPSSIPSVAYFVIMSSSLAYGMMTWANKHATGTLVTGYTVMQPVASAVLIEVLLLSHLYQSCFSQEYITEMREGLPLSKCLHPPQFSTLIGAIGVFSGLFIVVVTEPKFQIECYPTETPTSEMSEIEELLELPDSLVYGEGENWSERDAVRHEVSKLI